MPTFLEVSRRNVGLTQGELATMSGVSRATISAIERGGREPSRQTLEKLDQALLRAANGTALTWSADALPHQWMVGDFPFAHDVLKAGNLVGKYVGDQVIAFHALQLRRDFASAAVARQAQGGGCVPAGRCRRRRPPCRRPCPPGR